MNRKRFLTVVIVGLLIALTSVAAYANTAVPAASQDVDPNPPANGLTAVAPQPNFVDEDADGVCDTCGHLPGSMTMQGQMMQNRLAEGQMRQGEMPNFVDEDGDGLCDTCGHVPGTGQGQMMRNAQQGMNGQGQGQGQMLRQNQQLHQQNFVDADGDGVCDNMGSGAGGQNQGQQHGRGQQARGNQP